MKFCWKCGARLQDEAGLCPVCGAPGSAANTGEGTGGKPLSDGAGGSAAQGLKSTGGEPCFDDEDIGENKAMAACSYLGALVLVPLLGAKESKFARFHANQGLALLLASVVCGASWRIVEAVLLAVSWRLYAMAETAWLAWLVFPALSVIGIRNAMRGEAKELPVIGKVRLLR